MGGRGQLDWLLWAAAATLAASVALFEFTSLDLMVQDCFYDFTMGTWLVDGREPTRRMLFYDGPKVVIYLIAGGLVALLIGPTNWRSRANVSRRDLWVPVLALAIVPVLAASGKRAFNVFCPYEIRRYGGDMPYVKVLEPYAENDMPERRSGCFPAGHASGGFALLGLWGLRESRRWRVGTIAFALAMGWWMGLYQMLRGVHYLSHTVTTMLLAWVVVLALRRVLGVAEAGR